MATNLVSARRMPTPWRGCNPRRGGRRGRWWTRRVDPGRLWCGGL